MTRYWITASWRLSCVLACHAVLLAAACSPSSSSSEPRAPTAVAPAPSAGLAPEEAPPGPPAETAPVAGEPAAEGQVGEAWARPVPPDPAPAGAEAEPADEDAGSEQMVEFFETGRGDRVADLGGVFGYSLTPVRRALGPAGILYVRRRTPPPADPAADDEGGLGKLVWMNTPDEAPFSAEATRLNGVTLLFAYHAVVAAGRDRRKMNGAVYRALVPGGVYIIADHQAPPGSGIAAAREENRIEDGIVRSEVQAAGFEFVEAADFVSNAIGSADRSGAGQYLLKFRKPK
jgi:predicted methyltransferase